MTATTATGLSGLDHLRLLEAEAVHILREVVAELERPVLLFSGGKDSIVLLRLAEKAFAPMPLPFPVLHVDTGHNFPEVLEFRDRRLGDAGHELIECARRDPKGLYARARAGEIKGFTGVDAPYEAPAAPELHVPTTDVDVEDAVAAIVALLRG
jgi:fermentation-respiration switch protein FrsA (DUF1100 family)